MAKIMSDFGEAHVGAIIINCDNESATVFFKIPTFHRKTRNIE